MITKELLTQACLAYYAKTREYKIKRGVSDAYLQAFDYERDYVLGQIAGETGDLNEYIGLVFSCAYYEDAITERTYEALHTA